MRRLLVVVVVLGLLLVGADRIAASVAARAVARQVASSQRLPDEPSVRVTGFPFLTQALRGRYDRVDVTVPRATREGVVVEDLVAHLRGVRVPLADAVGGRVGQVPVAGVDATARIPYASLVSGAGRRLVATPAGDQLRLAGEVQVLGRSLKATTLSDVRLDGRTVVVTARSVDVGNSAVDAALSAAVKGRFDLRVDVGALPYGLRLTGLRVAPDGLELRATSGATVLRPR